MTKTLKETTVRDVPGRRAVLMKADFPDLAALVPKGTAFRPTLESELGENLVLTEPVRAELVRKGFDLTRPFVIRWRYGLSARGRDSYSVEQYTVQRPQ